MECSVKEIQRCGGEQIISNELPLSSTEQKGLQEFMKAVCPSVHIPSHEAIYADCVQLFMDEKLNLKSFIKSINPRVCLTLDTWTPSQYVNYLCISAHFIDDSWDKHKKIPSFTTLYSDEGEEMGKLVEKCLHDWEIDNVMTITAETGGVPNHDDWENARKVSGEFYHLTREDICDSDEDEVKDNESDYSLWKTIVRSVLDIVSDLFYEYKDNIGTLQQSENFQECLKKRNLDAEGNVLTETQLDRYLNEDTVKYDDDFDISLWWKNNTETFPVLSKIAKDVLAIPLSAVGSESAFKAKFGKLVDDFRSSLSPSIVEALVCTEDWRDKSQK
nr:zinc finger BED domain-containing protein RICESLEEPER 2-like [Tanacetum cinerariifolium]